MHKNFSLKLLLLTIMFAMLISACESKEELTQIEVLDFLDEFERVAYKDLDIDEYPNFLSDDIVITMTSTSMPTEVTDKNEHMLDATLGWAMMKKAKFKYELTYTGILIDTDVANVSSETTIQMSIFGERVDVRTKDEMQIEKQNGRLVITKIDSELIED